MYKRQLVDCKDEAWVKQLVQAGCEQQEVIPAHVTENQVTVQVPENLTAEVAKSTMWEEYNSRCINCGRCNFVCPTDVYKRQEQRRTADTQTYFRFCPYHIESHPKPSKFCSHRKAFGLL